jgi:hypothetical protein
MHKPLAVVLTCVALVVASGVALAATGNFRAHGTGDLENPANDSRAQLQATFKLTDAGLEYKLNVSQLRNVRFAHIHLGQPEDNGPIVTFLAGPFVPVLDRANGRLSSGVITDADLIGPLAGKTVADLVAEIEAGNAYANAHTDQFPGGEVRGPIR